MKIENQCCTLEQSKRLNELGILKDVVGFDGLYLVSDVGDVYSLPRNTANFKKLKLTLTKNGYLRVCLFKDKRKHYMLVHRLVGIAHIPNPENHPQLNHIDGIKITNTKENLEWCTSSENSIHAARVTGVKYRHQNGKHPLAKLNEAQVLSIKRLRQKGLRIKDIAERHSVSLQCISDIINNRRHKYLITAEEVNQRLANS